VPLRGIKGATRSIGLDRDLEEIYYCRIDHPDGYAFQRLYDAAGTRHDTLMLVNGDLVLIKDGYHPVVAAHGYNMYYLNVLAGSARSTAVSDGPRPTRACRSSTPSRLRLLWEVPGVLPEPNELGLKRRPGNIQE
jgi:5-deoxy-D-glucuronate isomerase